MTQAAHASDAGHAEAHPHHPFLAHHFGSMNQQFDAGKFGMWLFLVTEVLFFSGLFCAYAVYRRLHPEAFANADQFLDVTLGATNTAVLIFSSLTMAWAVRAAQLGQKKLLVILLIVTLACASMFLGVKAVEYSHKWDMGILWSKYFNPTDHVEHSNALLVLSVPAILAAIATAIGFGVAKTKNSAVAATVCLSILIASGTYFVGVGLGKAIPSIQAALTGQAHGSEHGESGEHVEEGHAAPIVEDPVYTGMFFSIYFVMTGLHAIHILAGMGVIVWLIGRSSLGHFGPEYFGPVDYVGLYWHLVDLIWIYLFPLLYLIG